MKEFSHLHLHTHYSTLDCTIRPEQLMQKLKADGQTAVAITDHGNMHGVIDFYKTAKAHDIKPIPGCEIYFTAGSRHDRKKEDKIFHLILLAMNNEGYKNLLKIVSIAYEEGFYYNARADMDLLSEYNEGIIAMTACISGVVPWYFLNDREEEAYKMADFFKCTFDKRFYLEVQKNSIPAQATVNEKLIKMSREMNVPLVGTCDCHYLNKEDSKIHDVLKLIQTKSTLTNRKMNELDSDFYVRTREEIEKDFKDIPEAIKSTQTIADSCNVEIELGEFHFPIYNTKRDPDYQEFLKWRERNGNT